MENLIKAFKAAGEPTRMRILAALSQYELTVTELVSLLGQSQPRVSRHLKLLLEAGFTVQKFIPFDFFPQTYHIETLSIWSR